MCESVIYYVREEDMIVLFTLVERDSEFESEDHHVFNRIFEINVYFEIDRIL